MDEENRWRFNEEPEKPPGPTCGDCDWCDSCRFVGHEIVGYCGLFGEYVTVTDTQRERGCYD